MSRHNKNNKDETMNNFQPSERLGEVMNNYNNAEEMLSEDVKKAVRKGCSVGCSTIVHILIAFAILGIMINECKRSDVRLEKDKLDLKEKKDSLTLDSIKKSKKLLPNTCNYSIMLRKYREMQK